eukprot:CAMPEP_0113869954 /NCGR_PEP_ID=MMETSP0780_2-20120614/1817_1 /TAXON_ID=652834 /ORGANISM="Palpitomonas bilix" /LENGTH=239 /DNA_ID=CAMNT_0000855177 /DNA_START=322 /DNA_END=1041 /DNA_ORIENTATION=+ /assembly_acc=CAM_ASM_000599
MAEERASFRFLSTAGASERQEISLQKIVDHLYIGGKKAASDREELERANITHIVNVSSDIPLFFEQDGDLAYLRIPIEDHPQAGDKVYSSFDTAHAFISAGMKKGGKQGKGGNVFVHCRYGRSRSATVVAAYLMMERGMSVDGVLTHLRKLRPTILPNTGFVQALMLLDVRLGRDPRDSTFDFSHYCVELLRKEYEGTDMEGEEELMRRAVQLHRPSKEEGLIPAMMWLEEEYERQSQK